MKAISSFMILIRILPQSDRVELKAIEVFRESNPTLSMLSNKNQIEYLLVLFHVNSCLFKDNF